MVVRYVMIYIYVQRRGSKRIHVMPDIRVQNTKGLREIRPVTTVGNRKGKVRTRF